MRLSRFPWRSHMHLQPRKVSPSGSILVVRMPVPCLCRKFRYSAEVPTRRGVLMCRTLWSLRPAPKTLRRRLIGPLKSIALPVKSWKSMASFRVSRTKAAIGRRSIRMKRHLIIWLQQSSGPDWCRAIRCRFPSILPHQNSVRRGYTGWGSKSGNSTVTLLATCSSVGPNVIRSCPLKTLSARTMRRV